MTEPVRKRVDGAASQEKILDAAARIAGERGYQGTSISAVSERSGLPASSIYWHFANKDELIAAVIDRSYGQWLDALDRPVVAPDDADGTALFQAVMRRVGSTLESFGDFLRLGLMLILDRNPDEPTARAKFMDVRAVTRNRIRLFYGVAFEGLAADEIEQLATLTLVLADGTFIAREADHLDVNAAYDLMATAILSTVDALQRAGSTKGS
jgi:AcrR family transcriptional regulator